LTIIKAITNAHPLPILMIDVQATHPFLSPNVMEIGFDYTYTRVENDESLPHETPF
jgi:hypothetical protein